MKIEFIIPTCDRPEKLMVILSSLWCQSDPNWTAHVVMDGVFFGEYKTVQEFYKNESRIRWTELKTKHNDWGHTPRNHGLKVCQEEWVVMTGDDNYYVPEFVQEFLNAAKNTDTDFIFCNMVHNWVAKEYIAVNCAIQYGRIDIGCFMTRAKLAQTIPLNTKVNEADWLFARDFLAKYKNKTPIKIPKFLYVHN